MTDTHLDGPVHLVLGPDQHGVVRHALHVAEACGHRVVRHRRSTDLLDLPPCEVVHLPFTERLLGPDLASAIREFDRVAALVHAAGAALSVTLHDLPHDRSPFQQRRLQFYDAVIDRARGVVVNSRLELALVQDRAATVHSLRLIRLPIHPPHPSASAGSPAPGRTVAVLGYIYPDRGYEYVLAALPQDSALVALGRPAEGHEDLAERLRAAGRFTVTGFLPEDELAAHLTSAAVPIAPNPRITASASINSWLAHGRRPLVPDSPYARELLDHHPDGVLLYDPEDPQHLRTMITAALADPSLTRFDAASLPAPTIVDVAAQYRRHLAACRPPAALATPAGVTVPGNRFDLLPGPDTSATATVVIPYYDNQPDLDRIMAALRAQTHTAFDVVVVDDGSPEAPRIDPDPGCPVRVLREPDRGFRAAHARNVGARAATGEVLVFLDGDTVPEPDYVRRMVDAAAVGETVAVGRRRHADLSSLAPKETLRFLDGSDRDAGLILTEPAWLAEHYARSHDLLQADRRSYRYVISAVLAVRRDLFAELGGFDERFDSYGGEDWELTHRAWVAGALLRHVPAAVAWHDGPDWAERGTEESRARSKQAERAALAQLLPDPDERGARGTGRYPSIVVHAGALAAVDAVELARGVQAARVDCAVHVADAALAGAHPGLRAGAPAADVLARAWCQVWLRRPVDPAVLPALAELASAHGTVRTAALTAVATRTLSRSGRHAGAADATALAEWLFGRHDRALSPG